MKEPICSLMKSNPLKVNHQNKGSLAELLKFQQHIPKSSQQAREKK